MNAITTVEQNAIAQVPALSSGPMANAIAAMQAGMSIEQMRGIMDLQKEWEENEARKAYVADMAAFKLNPPEIYKTKLVAFSGTEYMHATLGDVARAVVEALARHGFSHSWSTTQAAGVIKVTCKITHRLGHSESTTMESSADISGKKNAIQAIASAQTYLSRYTLLQSCGLATMDMPDDDGQSYGETQAEMARVMQRPAEVKTLPGYKDAEFDTLFPSWQGAVQSGKKTPDELLAYLQQRASLTESQAKRILNCNNQG